MRYQTGLGKIIKSPISNGFATLVLSRKHGTVYKSASKLTTWNSFSLNNLNPLVSKFLGQCSHIFQEIQSGRMIYQLSFQVVANAVFRYCFPSSV